MQQYGGLLGLSGGSYTSNSNALRVEIYPNIVNSYEFQQKIANASFYFPAYDTTVALNDYYLNVREPSLLSTVSSFVFGIPAQIIGVFTTEENGIPSIPSQDTSFITLTEEEEMLLQFLRENVNARLDEETGFISVSARMEDPLVAAQVASFAIKELTNYLIDYRTEKLVMDLEYTKEQLDKADYVLRKRKSILQNLEIAIKEYLLQVLERRNNASIRNIL